ncbi:MAG: hypothetical protein SNJ77_09135, partial [Cytophagales bacterium]
ANFSQFKTLTDSTIQRQRQDNTSTTTKLSHIYELWATLKDNDSEQINEQTKTGKCHRTNGTFGFCQHTSQRSKNQKSHFLPTHGQTNGHKKVNLTTYKILDIPNERLETKY